MTYVGKSAFLNNRLTIKGFLHFEIASLIALYCLAGFGLVPGSIYYIFDFINILLFILSLKRMASVRGLALFGLVPTAALATYCLISGLVNGVAVSLILWEGLTLCRLPLFLLLICTYWDFTQLRRILKMFYKLQILNVFMVAIEMFVFGLIQDQVGGIFGVQVGCNGPLNVYLCIVCAYAVSEFLAQRDSRDIEIGGLILTCVASFLVAAVAEIKFFYLELPVILIIVLLITRPTRRTVAAILIAAFALAVGAYVLGQLMPDKFRQLMDISALYAEADNTVIETGYGISRIHAFSQIDGLFFHDDLALKLFGLGFGSATGSSSGLFLSPLYRMYGYLNYDYLQLPTMYIQTGYIGVVLYSLVIAVSLLWAVKDKVAYRQKANWVVPFAASIVVLFYLNCFYMSTMRTQFAVLWAIVLSAPFLASKTFKEPDNLKGRLNSAGRHHD